MIASAPPHDVPVPSSAASAVEGAHARAVWENELGGLTFEVVRPGARQFLKWFPAGCGIDPDPELARLAWAGEFTPVPRVEGRGGDETGSWVLTGALPGDNAVAARWLADPAAAVHAVGAGLRALHDALPVERCPFDWSAQARLADLDRRLAAGRVDPAGWPDEHRPLGIEEAVRRARLVPSVDRLVVCHGDACAPNTLIGFDGRPTGHVDLGTLGVADRWADLAVAAWSTEWNYGPGWAEPLLAAYGVEPDTERIAYYRLLWTLGP